MLTVIRGHLTAMHRLFSIVLALVLILSMISVIHYPVSAQVNEKDVSRGVKTGNTYDFSSGAGVDKWAYEGSDANGVPPSITSGTEFTNYSKINSSDNTMYSTGGGSATKDPYHLFKFTISEKTTTITNLTISWEGYNDAGTSKFYLWNFTSSLWELLGSHTQTAADGTITVSKTTGISNYINASGCICLCAIEITNSGTTIYTDYVYVSVTSEPLANFTLSLQPGWNLITLPVYNSSLTTAEQLADAIPCDYVRRYNSSSQDWEMHERNKTENNFQLENGTGYFVYLENGKDFMIEGKEVPGVEISLKKGWNSIGWYENNTAYPKKIMSDIINSSSVAYWNTTLSRFIIHPKTADISNFSVPEGAGLFIYTETDSVWDTLPTIFSVEHDAGSVLGPYDKFNVTLKGDEGYNASFDIGSAVTGIAMSEESPGVYKGSYTIGTGDPSGTYNIIGHLSSERYTDNKDAPTTVTIDTTAPAGITDLAATASTTSGTNVTLMWTSPGDDGTTGTASTYDIRYSTSIIDTDAKFNSATQCTGEPAPKAAGGSETFTVTGLTEGTTYYFAIKTGDEVPNWSPLSNSPNAKPSVAPAAITDLATSSPTQNSIALNWTAPGNDGNTGTASSYDIRHYTSAITDSNWASATQCTGEPTPKSAGSAESFTVTGLSASTTYYFAIKTGDEVPNWSPISNSPNGTTSAPPDTTLPNVTSTTPANSATNVAVTTTIVVQFSEAMNKTNTEGAFSTSPATTGTFSWNAAGDKMTYTPSASLSYSTTYTVSITNSATDLAGNKLDGNGNGVVDNPASKDTYTFSFTTEAGGGTVNKYAVIVGISDYKATSDLSYCDEDASDWYNYLNGQGYTSWVYGDGHTANYPKHDGYATEYNVKQAIQNMIAEADSNDIIAYIDSGHGTKVGGQAVCCMWDYSAGENGEDGALKDSELKALFDGVNCGGIFIFLDTCNSGGMNGVMSNANANIVYMATTCTANGYGYDDSTSKNGLWTEYFLNKGLVGGQSGHTDMEGNFQWAHDNYPKTGADEPQQFDGDTAKLFYLKPP